MKGTLRVALVAVSLVVTSALAAADAAAPSITITWPEEGLTITSDRVEVKAAYSASGDGVVEQVDFVVNGRMVDARLIEPPQASGTVSFVWAARRYPDGQHEIALRAADSQGGTAEQSISVWIERAQTGPVRGIRIASPRPGDVVAGEAAIQVEADQPALVRYVIFLVDDVFKAMSNVRPFTYVWDTTRYLNGLHDLRVKAYLSNGGESLSRAVEVRVDNPGGATSMAELKVSSEAAVAPEPMRPPDRAGRPTVPPPMHTESPTPVRATITVAEPEVGPPGTAPFVSPTGALIRPPSPALARESFRLGPMQISEPPAEPDGAAPRDTPAASATAPPLHSPDAGDLPTVSPVEVPAAVTRAPQPAPVEVALLPTEAPASATPAAIGTPAHTASAGELTTVTPAAPLTSEARSPEPSPIEVARLPEQAATPAPPAPPVRSVTVAEPAGAPSAPGAPGAPSASVTAEPAAEATRPTPSGLEVAMLPPRPVERAPAPKVTAEPAPGEVFYVVRPGDWLWAIAAEHGVSPKEVARANNIADPSLIKPGQRLRIPCTPVYFDNRPLPSDVPAVIARGRAIVPFRPVVEEAGGCVVWEPVEKRASAVARGHKIAVTIGSDQARVDEGQVQMDAPAALRMNRTVVPLRFLGDVLDLVLQYQDGVIHIASGR